MQKIYQKQSGFSLTETLIAMSILVAIAFMGYLFIFKAIRGTTYESEQETAIKNARRGLEIMIKEIRGANNSERGDYPLATIENDNFIYYSDIDDDDKMEKVRYYLNGTMLEKVITEPGLANDYSTPGATSTIARFVNNQEVAIFTYFDNDYIETAEIDKVRLINLKLKMNVTPERAPMDYYVETDVHLRNLKDNL